MDEMTDIMIKSFRGELSESEKAALENSLAGSETDRKKYGTLKSVYENALDMGMRVSPDRKNAWKEFLNALKAERRRSPARLWRIGASVAAAAALVCVSVLLFKDLRSAEAGLPSLEEYVASAGDMSGIRDTRLVCPDGKSVDIDSRYAEIVISEDGSYSINSVTIEPSACMGYNRLVVPERHWVHVVLPDGSRVDLNSSSDFVFPGTFSGGERQVHLCGEGYFSVAKDASRPFTVSTGGLKVSVLGTEFNMKSRDSLAEVTLVHGKVNVTGDDGKSCILSPSEQVRLENGVLSEARVVDTAPVTGWTRPRMVCRNQNIGQVAEKLSAYYGVEFRWTESLKDIVINGKLDLREELESVLNTIAFTAPVTFEREGDIIEIIRTDRTAGNTDNNQ